MAMIEGQARAETGVALEHVVPVCMSEGARTPDMYLARAIVSEMFEKIGVTIEWRFQGLCRASSGVISIKLSDDTPDNQFAGALAYALPFEGTRIPGFQITVFYDRVKGSVQPRVVPHLLAHVLAHEIGHVIEGTDHHSESGVMKAHWDLSDQDRMCRKPLTFSEFDVSLIHKGLEARR